jgi:adenine-specific DNA-methyltransferase
MSEKFERLRRLLRELFQLDHAELDFGLYRIMQAKREEVTRFLDRDLLPQIQEALSGLRSVDRAEIAGRLDVMLNQLRAAGVEDAESKPGVLALRAELARAPDEDALEADVYDHLYRFFSRYYSGGDFLSRRVYKEGTYAIPYEGEEVKLHWANADQYYIKSSAHLRDYSFQLRPGAAHPMRVHFRVVDSAEGPHGNVREDLDRRFELSRSTPIVVVEEELSIPFSFEPSEKKQAEANAATESAIAANTDPALRAWVAELLRVDPTESNPDRTILGRHLARYASVNTFDYFIHQDLGGFLRRELDFYLKNEVLHVGDLIDEPSDRIDQRLSHLRIIRAVALRIIAFLAQIEDFQKRLWLKQKFVIETQYCVPLEVVPDVLLPEIAANDAQREEWVRLFAIDKVEATLVAPGYSSPLTIEFLRARQDLVLDTRHFRQGFTERLVGSWPDLDELIVGIAIHSDNYQALQLLHARFRSAVQCIYVDPPFNTGDDFLFKDGYRFSSWLSFLSGRLRLGRELLASSGSQYLHLDHNANFLGRMLLDSVYGRENFVNEVIWRIGWVSGYKTQVDAFVRNHDTIFFYARDAAAHYFDKPRSRIPYKAFARDSIAPELQSIYAKWGVDRRQISNLKLSIKYPNGQVFKIGLADKEAGYNIEDTWNSSEYEELNSNKIKRNAAEYTPNGSLITQKPEELLKRAIELTTRPGDWVVDYFGGTGTTAAVALKLGRRFVTSEVESYFDSDLLWRFKQILGGQSVGISRTIDGKPSGVVKYIRLESYEDSLNNLEFQPPNAEASLFDSTTPPAGTFRESYLLRYMLPTESRGSASLLDLDAFVDPDRYTLRVRRPGSEETIERAIDLTETFNWLIGLSPTRISARACLRATFDKEIRSASVAAHPDGPWWVRVVEGVTRAGERTLILWRNRPSEADDEGVVKDDRVLEAWLADQGLLGRLPEFDLIYVNGPTSLGRLRRVNESWSVRLTEEEFFRQMFSSSPGL